MSARLTDVDIPNLGMDNSHVGSHSDFLTMQRIENKVKRFNDNSTCSGTQQNTLNDATR